MGTIAVSTISPDRRTNLTWLPFWLASAKPADSRRRLTSRNGSGLIRPNLDLNRPNAGRPHSLRWLEVQFQGLFQVGESFFFGFTLAGHVNLEALRDVPVAFAPYRCNKWPFHGSILAHGDRPNKLRQSLYAAGRKRAKGAVVAARITIRLSHRLSSQPQLERSLRHRWGVPSGLFCV